MLLSGVQRDGGDQFDGWVASSSLHYGARHHHDDHVPARVGVDDHGSPGPRRA